MTICEASLVMNLQRIIAYNRQLTSALQWFIVSFSLFSSFSCPALNFTVLVHSHLPIMSNLWLQQAAIFTEKNSVSN